MPAIESKDSKAMFMYMWRYWFAAALSIDVTDLRDDEVYPAIQRFVQRSDVDAGAMLDSLKMVAALCEQLPTKEQIDTSP